MSKTESGQKAPPGFIELAGRIQAIRTKDRQINSLNCLVQLMAVNGKEETQMSGKKESAGSAEAETSANAISQYHNTTDYQKKQVIRLKDGLFNLSLDMEKADCLAQTAIDYLSDVEINNGYALINCRRIQTLVFALLDYTSKAMQKISAIQEELA